MMTTNGIDTELDQDDSDYEYFQVPFGPFRKTLLAQSRATGFEEHGLSGTLRQQLIAEDLDEEEMRAMGD